MSDPLKINEIDSDIRVEYVNAFRAYSGPGEFILELGFVDIASSVKKAEAVGQPLQSLDTKLRGKFVLRPEQVPMLIETLQNSFASYNNNMARKG
ncbi:MAG TPA: hypothetical protein PLK28_17580 [Candidatus Rifleibacterium sp.]|jgi:hypothetical protein|nr:hypothetical protein [Candidatus Rifleibacterium sp.]HOI92316.1 hypothetical protein [Candidatus Rifleibacterium sp.]HPW59282.1 hypothetical protein [Candidatus Rifleibacterium sp.]HQB84205.1 hypothetical protein [Candidatus Rifleibacterium sp.]